MYDLSLKKQVTSKKGRVAIIRYIDLNDTDSLLAYVNKLGVEDTFVAINTATAYETELDYITDCVKRMRWGKKVSLGIFDGQTCLGEADVTVGGIRREHTGTLGISILNEVRGQGFGKALLEATLTQASEYLHLKMVRLSCFSINSVALNLYTGVGFKQIGVIPHSLYYKDQYVDEVLMYKELP